MSSVIPHHNIRTGEETRRGGEEERRRGGQSRLLLQPPRCVELLLTARYNANRPHRDRHTHTDTQLEMGLIYLSGHTIKQMQSFATPEAQLL